MGLDGGFLHNLVKELSTQITNTRVDKVFQPTRDEIVLNLRAAGFNKKLILSAKSGTAGIGFISEPPENPQTAPMFCMLLRKYIGGAKIREITQMGLERVVRISFETRNEMGDTVTPYCFVELITGSCNVILTDSSLRIIDAIRRSDIEKNVRRIQPGAIYTLPPSQDKADILSVTPQQLANLVASRPNLPIGEAFLKTAEGVSPLVSREIALVCDKDIDVFADAVPYEKLLLACEKLINGIKNGKPYMLLSPDGTPKDFGYMEIKQYGDGYTCVEYPDFNGLSEAFYKKKDAAARMHSSAQDTLKLLTVLSNRITRKIAARKNDLMRCDNREKYRIYGELIKANIYRINRGDSVLRAENYYSQNCEITEIPLNSALSAQDNAQKYFKEYKKLCVAQKTLQGLIEESENELKYIDSVFDALSRATSVRDLADIREELATVGYIKRPKNSKKHKPATKPDKYRTSDGFKIYVGKNNMQNDELTLRIADKTDIWFHTKNVHGAHVILKKDGRDITDTAVLQAALIAAYNSKAASSSGVAVDYTPVKYVKKPSGAKYGMVIYTNNKTVYVTPDENTVNSLKISGK